MVKRIIIAVMMTLLAAGIVSAPVMAAETGGTEFYQGICDDPAIDDDLKAQAGCNSNRQLMNVAGSIINAIIAVIGLVAVAVIIYGGIQYTTSLGDPGRITQARNTIIYGVIGLIVGILAFALVNFIVASIGSPAGSEQTNSSQDED